MPPPSQHLSAALSSQEEILLFTKGGPDSQVHLPSGRSGLGGWDRSIYSRIFLLGMYL